MLRVFLLLFLEAKTSEILEWRQRMSYNFTRVYEKVCKFFETRRWFGSESSVPCPLFFSFLLFFDITFLIADFILYFIFFLPRVCVKKSDAIDTRNTNRCQFTYSVFILFLKSGKTSSKRFYFCVVY